MENAEESNAKVTRNDKCTGARDVDDEWSTSFSDEIWELYHRMKDLTIEHMMPVDFGLSTLHEAISTVTKQTNPYKNKHTMQRFRDQDVFDDACRERVLGKGCDLSVREFEAAYRPCLMDMFDLLEIAFLEIEYHDSEKYDAFVRILYDTSDRKICKRALVSTPIAIPRRTDPDRRTSMHTLKMGQNYCTTHST